MRRPSIKFRLMFGSGLLIAVLLMLANLSIYNRIKHFATEEVDLQLMQSASLLSKSAELDGGRVVYEWKEALLSSSNPPVTGIFQFWDQKAGTTQRSPELGPHDLPLFHGALNKPVLQDITLHDGTPARAAGLLHLPFLDAATVDEIHRLGLETDPANFPQVLVCAREIHSVEDRLASIRRKLIYTTLATVAGIWISIYVISSWTLRPIDELSAQLLRRSLGEDSSLTEIPEKLPSELTALATAFGTTLQRVETARSHEQDFALHAAHELRTPIAGIHATLEQAVHRPRTEADLRERIGTALAISGGMRGTINSLLRLARLRGGIEKASREPIDPGPLLEAMIARETAQFPGFTIDKDIATLPIETDPGLFQILAGNLIENALHHSPAAATISLKAAVGDGGFTLEITNPRCGLRAEDGPRLFRPFQRGEHTDANSAGAGLGLALSQEIAELLGGTVEMIIRDETTVTFRVFLPREVAGSSDCYIKPLNGNA